MPISLKCACGAILEIDDRFRGQKIPCPDCQRPLEALSPIEAPPRAWPMQPLVGLALSLGGLLTIVGPLAGIVLGVLSIRKLDRSAFPGERRLAYASTGVGAACLLFAGWAFFAPNVLGLDAMLRVWKWTGKLSFGDDTAKIRVDEDPNREVTMTLPGTNWGKAEFSREIVYIEPWSDAYITALSAPIDAREEGDRHERNRQTAIDRFLESELAKALRGGAATGKPVRPEARDVTMDELQVVQEFLADFELGGIRRTFMFRILGTNPKMLIFVGGSRSGLWPRVSESVKQSLKTGRDLQ
ncbi:MAG: hypothetical protein K2X38_01875 [Gemmataceae bacterium]|nr:hypothetical protein [Gemmataceae bacterium]